MHDGTRVQSGTLADVLTQYRDEVVPSGAQHQRVSRDFAKLASRPLNRITASEIADWRDRRLQAVKPATVAREMVWLQHALDTAVRDWGVALRDNVVKQVRRPRVDNRRVRRLQAGEWQSVMDAARQCENP